MELTAQAPGSGLQLPAGSDPGPFISEQRYASVSSSIKRVNSSTYLMGLLKGINEVMYRTLSTGSSPSTMISKY